MKKIVAYFYMITGIVYLFLACYTIIVKRCTLNMSLTIMLIGVILYLVGWGIKSK